MVPGGYVIFRGNQKRKSIGFVTIGNDKLPSITNDLLVDGLMHNLLSISQINDNGYDIIFNQNSCKVLVGKMVQSPLTGRERTTFVISDSIILRIKM